MEIIFGWFFLSVIVGFVASGRGRGGFGWFFLSLIISPIICFLVLVALPMGKSKLTNLVDENGEKITPETHVRCPDCRELVRSDARKCKHCGISLVPQ